MKINLILITLLVIILLNSCNSDEEAGPSTPVKFDLADAKAILFRSPYSEKGTSSNGRTASSGSSNLFKIDSEGKVSSIIDSVDIELARTFSEGLYVETTGGRKFYVKLDNTFVEIKENVGNLVGANDNGDLVFSDVSILRSTSITVEKLQTSLDYPLVQFISGNLAVIRDENIYQIYDTVTKLRYNIGGCNGPGMVSIDNNKALIKDCQNKILIDMSTGERFDADISSWNGESLRLKDGVIVLSQSLTQEGNYSDFAMGHINSVGKLTLLSNKIFKPGDSCASCGQPNTTLFGGDNFLVVKELDQISIFDRSNNEITTILNGLNVIKLSFNNDIIYYLAEDNLGNSIIGIYDIITEENTLVENEISFDDIATFE